MAPRNGANALALGAVGAAIFNQCTFVPGPKVSRAPVAAAAVGTAATLGAAPAFADSIGDASSKLTEAAYPFFKDVDWFSNLYLVKPGSAPATEWVKGIDKLIVMGSHMDGTLLQKAATAHHNAISSCDGNGLITKSALTDVDAAIGRLIASVPESEVMDVYNTFSGLVSPDVPKYLMSTVMEEDAKKAYEGFLSFKDTVKNSPISSSTVAVSSKLSPAKLDAVGAAAGKLSSASYPFIKDVDWTSDLFLKPLPGVSGKAALELTDKMIVMGASMDPKLLKEAAEAHHKAIGSIDAKGVTSAADYEAVNSALGKLIASVPKSQVMDVYNAFAKIVPPVVGNFNYATFNKGADAIAAHKALITFSDAVKAAQV